jgi:hypothetical protein
MAYVEILRVRRVLLIYSIIVASLALVIVGSILSSPEHGIVINSHRMNGAHHAGTRDIPLSWLVMLAAYVATIVGTIIGTALSCERANASQAWTKPVSRERFALAYMGVDAVGVLAAFAVLFVIELVGLWLVGIGPYVGLDADVPAFLALGLGVAFAYYGVVQALSVTIGRSGSVAGISWPIAFALAGLASVHLPSVIHAVIVGLNFLNPIAYLTNLGSANPGTALPVALSVRIGLVWLLAVVSCATAVVIWKRLED